MDSTADAESLDPHQQALAWLVTMWSGEASAKDHQALTAWRNASEAHEHAWQAVSSMDQRLRDVPAGTAGPVLRAASRRGSRRAVLRGLALVFGGGAALHALRDTESWQAMTAQHTTATGERRELALEDGTRITMNTATALDVRFDAAKRRIDLRHGEIMIVTGKDHGVPHRDFVVHTAQGVARAVGTRFVVYQSGEHTQVKVYEGAVDVRPGADHGATLRIAAGRQTRLTERGAEPAAPLSIQPPAWLDGMLEAEQMRLSDFLAELARYRPGVIRCDPAVADLTVSGRYPVADTDRVLAALAQALPVRVSYATRYWARVAPR